MKNEAVTGPMTGERLTPVPSVQTTWERWRKLHPDTLVLSTDTGYSRDYSSNPYENYFTSPLAFLGFKGKRDGRLPEKELVLGIDAGVEVGNEKKAYPFGALRNIETPVRDTISGQKVLVYFDKDSEEAYVTDESGKRLPTLVSYWFVWSSFHPDTKIFKER